MSSIVLDTSVALKLVVAEPGTVAVRTLVREGHTRFAPDWVMAEVASGLASKMRFEELPREQAAAALRSMPAFFDELFPSAPLFEDAIDLSVGLQHAFYDCLFLALALREDAMLITADRKFAAAAARRNLSRHVQLLALDSEADG